MENGSRFAVPSIFARHSQTTCATSRSSVGICGHLLTATVPGLVGSTHRPEVRLHCTHTCSSASIPVNVTRSPAVGHSRGAAFVPLPASPHWEVGEFALEAFGHDAPMCCTALLADDDLAVRRSCGAKNIDAARGERRSSRTTMKTR